MAARNKQASQRAKGEGRRIRRARNIVNRWQSTPMPWAKMIHNWDDRIELEDLIQQKRYDRAVALLAYYNLAGS